MWFHHVSQAGLELLTSGDPPALASQSAGITGHGSTGFLPANVQGPQPKDKRHVYLYFHLALSQSNHNPLPASLGSLHIRQRHTMMRSTRTGRITARATAEGETLPTDGAETETTNDYPQGHVQELPACLRRQDHGVLFTLISNLDQTSVRPSVLQAHVEDLQSDTSLLGVSHQRRPPHIFRQQIFIPVLPIPEHVNSLGALRVRGPQPPHLLGHHPGPEGERAEQLGCAP
ncbi:hypothetical protein AAY473_026614 [Plecturocebus cupreus]